MCLAIPARIEETWDDGMAMVDLGGVRKKISLVWLEDAAVGDYVLVHAGFALTKLSPAEAESTLALIAEAAEQTGNA